MLPNYFKIHIVNNTGAQIDFSTDGANNNFVITGIGWKFDSNGALTYGSEQTLFADPTADLANATSVEAATEMDNTSNLYLGYFCRATTDSDNANTGSIDIYWEYSTDGAAGTYVSDEGGFTADEDLIWIAQVINTGGSAGSPNARGVNFTLGASPF